MKPYYSHNGIEIYHGDCREMGDITSRCDLLVTDPPYGIKDKTRRGTRGSNQQLPNCGRDLRSKDWSEIEGDDSPFNPSMWLAHHKIVTFGANHYASRLPDSSRWLIWDKREGTASDDNADCEMAWSNVKGPARIFRQLWRGVCKRGEENHSNGVGLQHPHQKPIALMQWAIMQCYPTGYELLLDPYMGSGTTLSAAKRIGISAIGIEIEERYCEIAAKRGNS